MEGMNTNPLIRAIPHDAKSRTTAPMITIFLCAKLHAAIPLYLFMNLPSWLSIAFSGTLFNKPFAIAGTKVSAIIRLASNEYATVSARSTNNVLVIPSTKTIGTNTHIVVSVDAVMAPATCTAPETAACILL